MSSIPASKYLTQREIKTPFIKKELKCKIGEGMLLPLSILKGKKVIVSDDTYSEMIYSKSKRIAAAVFLGATFPITLPLSVVGVVLIKNSKCPGDLSRYINGDFAPINISSAQPLRESQKWVYTTEDEEKLPGARSHRSLSL